MSTYYLLYLDNPNLVDKHQCHYLIESLLRSLKDLDLRYEND